MIERATAGRWRSRRPNTSAAAAAGALHPSPAADPATEFADRQRATTPARARGARTLNGISDHSGANDWSASRPARLTDEARPKAKSKT